MRPVLSTADSSCLVRYVEAAVITAGSLVTSETVAVKRCSSSTVRLAHTATVPTGIRMAASTMQIMEMMRRGRWRVERGDPGGAADADTVPGGGCVSGGAWA